MNYRLKKKFDEFNQKYWDGKLMHIEICGSRVLGETLGLYYSPFSECDDTLEEYKIVISLTQSKATQHSTLLHEMCHHSVFLSNKEKHFKNKWKWHGRAWQAEMKKVGFTGKIDEYT